MHTLKTSFKKIVIFVSIITLMGGSPLAVLAETATDGSNNEEATVTEEVKNNPQYSFDPVSGNWVSDKYSWNPNTGITSPLPRQEPTETPGPEDSTVPEGSQLGTNNATGITGSGTNNQTNINGDSTVALNNNTGLNVNNQIGGRAVTGNASVSSNTAAGSAATGDAQSIANIMNMLQSNTNLGGQGMVSFQQDINGDVVGDILLNPELIFNVGPNSNTSSTVNQSTDATINNNSTAEVDNQIDLTATSGNATIDSNTKAGDASTGDAYVMANVVNVLNSVISANQSFMGLINIYGNLDGDILFPPETINKLLTSNVPTSSIAIDNATGNISLNNNSTQSTANNINLNANSGTANVSGNTTAGSATSGSAKTNLTVLNLTGREVIGENSILVFVNVLGTWMGMIMDAPNGATAAAIGGGITENNQTLNADITNNNNSSIKNNINLTATTGGADVTNNTEAGNASTGNAYAAANVANVNNSSLNLKNWFGLLFINVFGSWNGSFGIDTLAGTRTQPTGESMNIASQSTQSQSQVFSFVPAKPGAANQNNQQYIVTATEPEEYNNPIMLASASTPNQPTGQTGGTEELAGATKNNNRGTLLFTGTGLIVGIGLMSAERISALRESRRNKNKIFAGQNTVYTAKEV